MKIGELCNRVVIYVHEDESVRRVTEIMRRYHVGNVVVTQFGDKEQRPVGMVTDRDVVVEVIAQGVDPDETTAGDIMSEKLLIVREDEEVMDVVEAMRKKGIRRVPVVDVGGSLVGVVALDDLLQLFASGLSAMADIVGTQRYQEARLRA
ncbi:MAG TPA: CBS domain-containing protein [Gammaproteobacteria bacterium]|nr:CBS domain-containing protein [Gammaproteobacteria bacterium]